MVLTVTHSAHWVHPEGYPIHPHSTHDSVCLQPIRSHNCPQITAPFYYLYIQHTQSYLRVVGMWEDTRSPSRNAHSFGESSQVPGIEPSTQEMWGHSVNSYITLLLHTYLEVGSLSSFDVLCVVASATPMYAWKIPKVGQKYTKSNSVGSCTQLTSH